MDSLRLVALWAVLFVLALLSFDRQVALAACRSIPGLAPQSAYAVADARGRIVEGCNLDRPMVPASILKIATVSSALHILGPDYRFQTEFFLDPEQNLIIKGYGDPSLTSEEVAQVIDQLSRLGLHRVGQVIVDDSSFALEHQVPGQAQSDNPYDAPIGPLSVNFNALPFVRTASGIKSDEPQTPTLPLMAELGRAYPPGRYRINICSGRCRVEERMARYSGELFIALMRRQGIEVAGYGGRGRVSAQDRLFYRHFSRQNVTEISQSLLHYSSNYMANLLFLTCGAVRSGYPVTWDKARRVAQQQLQQTMGGDAALITQIEGAGLSRENQVTARAMLHLLHAFREDKDLLNQEHGVAMKTGTLTGVYNLAGYLENGDAFVILLTQKANTRTAILHRLQNLYAPK